MRFTSFTKPIIEPPVEAVPPRSARLEVLIPVILVTLI